jgi:hypothetical protein
MTLPSVRSAPPEANQHGYTPSHVSPHGHLSGVRGRLRQWIDRMGRDRTLPWVGVGLVKDLEVILQLLNLQEFAEWLRVNGPPEHRGFADDILADQFTLEAVRDACDSAGQRNEPDPVKAVENLQAELGAYDDMRRVLVETGALADDDHETPLPDLLRALLS